MYHQHHTILYMPCLSHNRIDDNGLQSTLYFDSNVASDLDGKYSCWIQNKHAMIDPAGIFIIRRKFCCIWGESP